MSTTSSSKDASITLNLSCFCQTFKSTIRLPASSFPLKSGICHCASCRHTSGHLFGTFLPLPLATKPPHLTTHSGLVPYHQTENLTRWFCGTCGASVYNDNPAAGLWVISTGIIESVERPPGDDAPVKSMLEGLQDRVQCFVGAESTGDGGAAVWINGGTDQGMPRMRDASADHTVTDTLLHDVVTAARAKARTAHSRGDDTTLPIHCACGRVQLSLVRDDAMEKFAAGFDACTSCRRVTGAEVASWVTTTPDRLRHGDGGALDLARDCFTTYSTSPGVLRVFCPGCGASVFYYKADEGTIAFGAGLVDADGARAESWLEWNRKYGDGRVLFAEDAVDRDLVEGLVRGIENDEKQA